MPYLPRPLSAITPGPSELLEGQIPPLNSFTSRLGLGNEFVTKVTAGSSAKEGSPVLRSVRGHMPVFTYLRRMRRRMRICICRCTHRIIRRQHLETRVLIKVTPLTSSERLCITVFAGTLSGHVKARGNELRRFELHSTLPSPKADCRDGSAMHAL